MNRHIAMLLLLILTATDGVQGQARVRTRPGSLERGPVAVSGPAELMTLAWAGSSIVEPSGNGLLDAGERGMVQVTLYNPGVQVTPAFRCGMVITTVKSDVHVGSPVEVSRVDPGDSVLVSIPVVAGELATDGDVEARVEVSVGSDVVPGMTWPVRFSTRRAAGPDLQIVEQTIDDLTNHNGVVEPREFVEVTVRLQNRGGMRARDVRVTAVLGANVFLEGGPSAKAQWQAAELAVGGTLDCRFTIYTTTNATSLPIAFNLSHAGLPDVRTVPIDLSQSTPPRGTTTPTLAVRPNVPGSPIPSMVVADIDGPLPKTTNRNIDGIAVVIGNAKYQKTRAVDFAERDAASMRRYLVEVLGYREGNIFFLTNASKGDLDSYFGIRGNHRGKLFNAIKPELSDVFVYYSGHGAPGLRDRKGYLVPVECDPNYLELQGYPLDVLYENLSKLPARSVTLVMDACFSGENVYRNISPIVIRMDAPAFTLRNGVIMTSSMSDQVSSWHPEMQHGLFTYYFLKSIHDRSADANRDGVLTLEEIYQSVADRTNGVPYQARRMHGVEQQPTIQGELRRAPFIRYE